MTYQWEYRLNGVLIDPAAVKDYYYQGIELEILENGIVIGYTDIKEYE